VCQLDKNGEDKVFTGIQIQVQVRAAIRSRGICWLGPLGA
jgi:hypothetical protein